MGTGTADRLGNDVGTWTAQRLGNDVGTMMDSSEVGQ